MQVKCGLCGAMLNVPDHMAGKTGTCNHCHGTITMPKTPRRRGIDAVAMLFGQAIGFSIMLAMLFVVVPFGYAWYKSITPEAKARQEERQQARADEAKFGSEWDAEAAAFGYVMSRLDYPGSAQFLPDNLVINTMNRWKVKGYLDAANQYGTPVRHNYSVIMEYNERTKKFDAKTVDVRAIGRGQ